MGARDGREVDIAMCPCNGRRYSKGGIMGEEKVALAVVWRVRKLGFYGKNVHFFKDREYTCSSDEIQLLRLPL